MRKLLALVAALIVIPAASASAAELDEILERSQEATYSAEQVISCTTPDGVRDAVVSLEQTGAGLHVSGEVEVSAGYGGWEVVREGAVVSSASVKAADTGAEPIYRVDEGVAHPFLNRKAGLYKLYAGDVLRAEMIVDGATGALLSVSTYNEDGTVYCERKFIEFDPTPQEEMTATTEPDEGLEPGARTSAFPESLGDFRRLDIYEDGEGLMFAYYSDGFFSFAVFQTPSIVALDDAAALTIEDSVYAMSYSPGQVTYSWGTHRRRDGAGRRPAPGHARRGPRRPGCPGQPRVLQRIWRSLFG